MIGFWSSTSWQQLGSYQDEYQLLTVCTRDNFVVLPHWETRSPAPYLDILLWANQSLSYLNNAEHLARKQQIFNFLSHWFDSTRFLTREARAPMIQSPRSVQDIVRIILVGSFSVSIILLWLSRIVSHDAGKYCITMEQLYKAFVSFKYPLTKVSSCIPMEQHYKASVSVLSAHWQKSVAVLIDVASAFARTLNPQQNYHSILHSLKWCGVGLVRLVHFSVCSYVLSYYF